MNDKLIQIYFNCNIQLTIDTFWQCTYKYCVSYVLVIDRLFNFWWGRGCVNCFPWSIITRNKIGFFLITSFFRSRYIFCFYKIRRKTSVPSAILCLCLFLLVLLAISLSVIQIRLLSFSFFGILRLLLRYIMTGNSVFPTS